MKFDIPKRQNPNLKRYRQDDLNLAYKFAAEIRQELGVFLKGVILFGSTARKQEQRMSDVDILLLIDDISQQISQTTTEAYKIIVQKVISRVSVKLHVISMRLTSFWEYVKAADPVAINILRDGVALIDSGFFDPLQVLLYRGRIRPTKESIWAYFTKAPATLNNSRWHIKQASLDLYWAVIDSAHAALMNIGEVPPSPDHVAELLQEKMVKTQMLEEKYISIMRNFYKLSRMIAHHEISDIKGDEYEKYYKDASDFVARMREFIEPEHVVKKKKKRK